MKIVFLGLECFPFLFIIFLIYTGWPQAFCISSVLVGLHFNNKLLPIQFPILQPTRGHPVYSGKSGLTISFVCGFLFVLLFNHYRIWIE